MELETFNAIIREYKTLKLESDKSTYENGPFDTTLGTSFSDL